MSIDLWIALLLTVLGAASWVLAPTASFEDIPAPARPTTALDRLADRFVELKHTIARDTTDGVEELKVSTPTRTATIWSYPGNRLLVTSYREPVIEARDEHHARALVLQMLNR